MTASGYPRIVKLWRRGTPMDSADSVYEGSDDDMYIAAYRDHSKVSSAISCRAPSRSTTMSCTCIGTDGGLVKIDVPNSAQKSVHKRHLLLELREPWTVAGTDLSGRCADRRRFR